MKTGLRGGHPRFRCAVLAALAALVLALWPGAAALGQASGADPYVVVLATVARVADRPATPIPDALRGRQLYWRVLRSGNDTSYQLCLGFFDRREEAEQARQLAAGFREARVIQVQSKERDDFEKAARAASPAAETVKPAAAAPPPPPATSAQA